MCVCVCVCVWVCGGGAPEIVLMLPSGWGRALSPGMHLPPPPPIISLSPLLYLCRSCWPCAALSLVNRTWTKTGENVIMAWIAIGTTSATALLYIWQGAGAYGRGGVLGLMS